MVAWARAVDMLVETSSSRLWMAATPGVPRALGALLAPACGFPFARLETRTMSSDIKESTGAVNP
ncbi:hypothetical protein GmHk_U060058 [Glycine max]|nr:hypothetical protein GmHk_U060058 [Glycine max]